LAELSDSSIGGILRIDAQIVEFGVDYGAERAA